MSSWFKAWLNRIRAQKGAFTLEATLVMPVVIAVVLTIGMLMRVVSIHGMMQHALLEVSRELGKYSYVYSLDAVQDTQAERNGFLDFFEMEEEGAQWVKFLSAGKKDAQDHWQEKLLIGPLAKRMMKHHFTKGDQEDFHKRLKQIHVLDGVEGLSFEGSKLLEDGESIELVLNYQIQLPLPIKLLPELSMVHRATVRAWLGGEKWSGVKEDKRETDGEEYVWNAKGITRGKEIHKRLGQNLPHTFPVIRKFEDGKITGMRSIDLTAATYQDMRALERTIKEKINDVAQFEGATMKDIKISKEEVKEREVWIIFPKPDSLVTQAVAKVLMVCEAYGRNLGVEVQVIHYGVLETAAMDDEILNDAEKG
jgi:hypothetical protein